MLRPKKEEAIRIYKKKVKNRIIFVINQVKDEQRVNI